MTAIEQLDKITIFFQNTAVLFFILFAAGALIFLVFIVLALDEFVDQMEKQNNEKFHR